MKLRLGLLAAIFLMTIVFSIDVSAQRNDGKPVHNFGGTWSLTQSNGIIVTLNLKHDGFGDIQGRATAYTRGGNLTGKVTGRSFRTNGASGWQSNVDNFQIEIAWGDHVGVYTGSASWADGVLKGQTYHKDKPSSKRVGWTAERPFARKR